MSSRAIQQTATSSRISRAAIPTGFSAQMNAPHDRHEPMASHLHSYPGFSIDVFNDSSRAEYDSEGGTDHVMSFQEVEVYAPDLNLHDCFQSVHVQVIEQISATCSTTENEPIEYQSLQERQSSPAEDPSGISSLARGTAHFIPTPCNLCGILINITQNSEHALHVHRGSRKCQLQQRKLAKQRQSQISVATAMDVSEESTVPVIRTIPPTPQRVPVLPSNRAVSEGTFASSLSAPHSSSSTWLHPARLPTRSTSVPIQVGENPYLSGDEYETVESDTRSDVSGSDRDENDTFCAGVPLEWHAGSVFTTFPWQIFDNRDGTLGFFLAGFENSGSGGIWIRSDRCAGKMDPSMNACDACRVLQPPQVIRRADLRAQATVTDHWAYKWLTYDQLVVKLNQKAEEIMKLKIKANNQALKVHRLIVRLDDYKRLVMAVATKDVKRIRQLLNLALKEGMSPRAILSRIERAVEGVYEVRGYDEFDFDLARLLRHLSGRKGLFALSKAIGLPSTSTIQNRLSAPIITPCSSRPKPFEIAQNIISCSRALHVPEETTRGFGLMIDGLALNQRARWWKSTNQIVGFCREHTEGLDLAMTDLPAVLKIVDAVHGTRPSCHYARESTVAAIGGFGQKGYEPVPIMVSGTCKSETSEEFAVIVRLLIEQWKIHGSGSLWIVSTDGDATFRGAMFRVLMDSEFERMQPLHTLLSPLEGLNLNCSKDEVVMCPDPKHILKRAATLLRSKDGMLINDTIVNRNTLQKHLSRLPGQNDKSVAVLIDPKDHQNVPRAVRLLTTLSALADADSLSLDPSGQSDMCAIRVIAKLWKSLLQAFIDPKFSLSDQLRSLSTYAHMCFALFTKHKSSFMTGQLYSDTQALVKAAFVCVARQVLLDPTRPFYLYQLGSDRLEEIFCEVRTMSHDCNCDLLQLCDRLSDSADCIAIFNRHPNWNRGHRRTSYSGSEGVDHVNPTYFEGDLIVQNVYLATVWTSGKIDASNFLQACGIDFDFTAVFSRTTVDFMCPFGGSNYPGVSSEPDRSLLIDDSTPIMTHLDADNDEAYLPGGIELDDLLGEPDSQGVTSSSQSENRDWIECLLDSGKKKSLHKASILSSLFHSDYSKLSVDRLLRVRCYSKDWRKADPNDDSLCGKKAFLTGDLAICPVHLRDSVAVVLVKISTIDRKGIRLMKIDVDELGQATGSDIQFTAQVLTMSEVFVEESEYTVSPTSVFNPTSETAPPSESWIHKWAWTGNFANISSSSSGTGSAGTSQAQGIISRKDHLVRITGDLLYPVTADSEPISILPVEARSTLDAKQVDRTWAINHDEYAELVDMLYGCIDPTDLLTRLTKYGDSDSLPYRDKRGSQCFLIGGATRILSERTGDCNKIACYQCGALIARDRARAHVGIHVLRALVGIAEAYLQEPVIPSMACGFCGRNGCSIALKKTPSKSFQVVTNCPRYHPFKYNTALTSSERTASTNVPIQCSLCGPDQFTKQMPTFWKYAMYDHIRVHHPLHWDHANRIPQSLEHELNDRLVLSSDEFSRITKDQAFAVLSGDNPVSLPFVGCRTTPASAVIAPSKRKSSTSRTRKNSTSGPSSSKRSKSSS